MYADGGILRAAGHTALGTVKKSIFNFAGAWGVAGEAEERRDTLCIASDNNAARGGPGPAK